MITVVGSRATGSWAVADGPLRTCCANVNGPVHDGNIENSMTIQFGSGLARPLELRLHGINEPTVTAEFAYSKILEMRFSLEAIGIKRGQSLRLQLSVWKGGLPMDALPPQGWIEISTAEPTDWPV